MELLRIYKSSFEAAHVIEGHPKCGVKHGHSYALTVFLKGDSNQFLDFHDLKTIVDSFVQTRYDHRDLGNITCEQIAEQIALHLSSNSFSGTVKLFETSKFGVSFRFGSSD